MADVSKSRRRFRYEVTESWGDMETRVPVGTVIVDIWKGNRTWNVMNMSTGKDIGGWRGKLLGEYKEKETES
jgi:hypothetical protein